MSCTGKLIEKDRLRAVPHATLSIEAKLKMQKGVIPVNEEENLNDEELED